MIALVLTLTESFPTCVTPVALALAATLALALPLALPPALALAVALTERDVEAQVAEQRLADSGRHGPEPVQLGIMRLMSLGQLSGTEHCMWSWAAKSTALLNTNACMSRRWALGSMTTVPFPASEEEEGHADSDAAERGKPKKSSRGCGEGAGGTVSCGRIAREVLGSGALHGER